MGTVRIVADMPVKNTGQRCFSFRVLLDRGGWQSIGFSRDDIASGFTGFGDLAYQIEGGFKPRNQIVGQPDLELLLGAQQEFGKSQTVETEIALQRRLQCCVDMPVRIKFMRQRLNQGQDALFCSLTFIWDCSIASSDFLGHATSRCFIERKILS